MEKKTKHAIANTLRRVGLLQYVDKIIYLKDLLEHRRANKKFMSTHKDFALPPAHLAFDAYGHSNMESYAVSGKVTAKIIADLILSNLDSENLTIFEWGCGPGRVIRHLKTQLKNANLELFGSDYNPESINWCKDNIKGIQFSINPLHPPLLYSDNFFNCAYALSVFTHLSEAMHFEWIKELKMVLKPNGILIITTHGKFTRNRLLLHEKQLFDSGKLVVRDGLQEGKKLYLAYHPPEFIKDKLLKNSKIVSCARYSDTDLDIWVARK